MSSPEHDAKVHVDINSEAYQESQRLGKFSDLKPGTLVIYSGGKLIASGINKNELSTYLQKRGVSNPLIVVVGDDDVIDIPTPFIEE